MVARAPKSELEQLIRAGVRADIESLIARAAPGTSQKTLSEYVGYTPNSLNKYLTGNNILLFVYLQVIHYFKDEAPDHPAMELARIATGRDAQTYIRDRLTPADETPDPNPLKISLFEYLATMRALRRAHPGHPALKLLQHLIRQATLRPMLTGPRPHE